MAEEYVRIGVDSREFVTGVNNATNALRRLQQNSGTAHTDLQRLQKQTTSTGSAFASVQKLAAAFGITLGAVGLARAAREAAKGFREFQRAMAEVSTLGDYTGAQIGFMTEKVREMSIEFAQAPVTTAKALYQIISAGTTDATKATQLLTQANKLAIGGVTDVATAADGLTSIMNAYGFATSEAARVSDAMFVGMRFGKTTIGELSGALGRVAPLASQVGVSVEELVGVISALTKAGIQTDVAVTSMRAVLSSILSPSKQAAEAASKLGIEFKASALQAKGFQQYMADLLAKVGGDQDVLVTLFEDIRSLNPMMALAGQTGKEYTAVMGQMAVASGETEKAYRKMAMTLDQRLNVALAKFKREFKSAGRDIAGTTVPAMEALARHAGTLKDALVALTLAAGTAGLLSVLLKLRGALVGLAVAETAVAFAQLARMVTTAADAGALLLATFSKTNLIVGGVLALGAAIFAIRKWLKGAAGEARDFTEQLQQITQWAPKAGGEFLKAERDRQAATLAGIDAELRQVQVRALVEKSSQARLKVLVDERAQVQEMVNVLDAEIGKRQQLTEGITVEIDSRDALTEEQQKQLEKYHDIADALEREVEAKQRAVAAARSSEQAMRREIDAYELSEKIRESTVDLTDQQAAAVARLITQVYAEDRALEKLEERYKRSEKFIGGIWLGAQQTTPKVSPVERVRKPTSIAGFGSGARETREELKRAAEEWKTFQEEVVRGLQRAFADGFRNVFENGLKGFREFGASVVELFRGVAAELASQLAYEKWLAPIIKDIKSGKGITDSKAFGAAGGALAGGMAGYQSGSPVLGAVSGAATGFALAGPVGGIVGAVGGLVGGLLGHAKQAKEAAARMREAMRSWSESVRSAIDQLDGIRTFGQEMRDSINSVLKGLNEALATKYQLGGIAAPRGKAPLKVAFSAEDEVKRLENLRSKEAQGSDKWKALTIAIDYANAKLEQFRREVTEFDRSLDVRALLAEGRVAEAEAMRMQIEQERELLDARERGYSADLITKLENVQAAERARYDEQRRLAEEAVVGEAEARRLSAAGRTGEADALRRAMENEKELRDAREQGYSEATIAALKLAQAEEALAAARAVAEQKAAFADDLLLRRAKLSGDAELALRTEMEVKQRQELAAAQKLVDAGTITQEMYNDLATLLGDELAAALGSLAEAAQAARDAITEDITLRELELDGRTAEAEALRLQIKQQKELNDAIDAGLSESDIDRLKRVQERERERQVAGNADASSAASASAGRSDIETMRDSITKVTETTALRLADLVRTSNVWLSKIASNTAAMHGGVGFVPTTGTGPLVTVAFYAPVTTSDPDKLAAQIASRINRTLGTTLALQSVTGGSGERVM